MIDVDTIRGRPFRYCIRSFNVDTFNRQNPIQPTRRLPAIRTLNYHYNFHQRTFFSRMNFFSIGCIAPNDDNSDSIHPSMNRNMRVDVSLRNQGRLYNRFQQSRCSGNSTADTSKSKPPAKVHNSDSSGNITESKSNRGTDPAFASYLTGEMKPQSILNELTKLSATSILNQRRTAAAKRSRSFALDTNNDKELYRQITDFQILQKEKSHRKTAFNVKRALIGNVIICTGKEVRFSLKCFFYLLLTYCFNVNS